MATIPGVSDGELIRTSWGDAVADELNTNTVKKTAAQTMTGPLTISGNINANGGTMSGDINMAGNQVYGLPTPTLNTDATTKLYVDGHVDDRLDDYMPRSGGVFTGLVAGVTPTTGGHLTTKAYVDSTFIAETGGVMTGDLLLGKGASDLNAAGLELVAVGGTEGRVNSTTVTSGNENLHCRHMGGTDDAGEQFALFTRSSANTTCGSITQFSASGGARYNETSDYRLKDELGPIVDPVDKLMALQPKHLRWKADQIEFDGFIAHEVDAVVPYAVTGAKDAVDADGVIDPQQLDAKTLIPLLTAALQDAHTQIAALTARLDVLEAG